MPQKQLHFAQRQPVERPRMPQTRGKLEERLVNAEKGKAHALVVGAP